MPPGLHVAVVPDSMVVSTGRVGEGLGTIGAPVRLLAGTVVFRRQQIGYQAIDKLTY